jgi:tetratricopeptide (TPR) repeat protein
MIPLLIPFAVIAVVSCVGYFRRQKWKNVAVVLVVFGILAVESNHNILGLNERSVRAEEFTTIGTAYLETNRIEQATLYYRKVLEVDSTYAQGYVNRGLLAYRSGNRTGAEADFRKAIQLAPGLTEAYLNLSTVLLDMNNKEGAVHVLRDAQRQFPINDQVSLKLGMTLFESGQLESGIAEIRRTLQLNPENATAQSVLQQILQYQQNAPKP